MAKWPYNTARWQRLRAWKLKRNPLCEYCPADTLTPATVVDHKKAINQGGDPWKPDNLASSCAPCHDSSKQIQERQDAADAARGYSIAAGADGWPADPRHPFHTGKIVRKFGYSIPDGIKPSAVPVHLVAGPPGSGKSTWVRERAQPDDVIIDLDDILEDIGGKRWDDRFYVVQRAIAKRNEILCGLCNQSSGEVYLIVGAPTQAERDAWGEALGRVTVTVLGVGADECARRLRADPSREAALQRLLAAVRRWWDASDA